MVSRPLGPISETMTSVSLAISAARPAAPGKATDAVSSAVAAKVVRASFISCISSSWSDGAVSEAEIAQEFRLCVGPRTRLFESAGGGEHGAVGKVATDDLHAHRQAGLGEARWNGCSRLAGQIADEGEAEPIARGHHLVFDD